MIVVEPRTERTMSFDEATEARVVFCSKPEAQYVGPVFISVDVYMVFVSFTSSHQPTRARARHQL